MLHIFHGSGDLQFLTWTPSDEAVENQVRTASEQIRDHLAATGSTLLHQRLYGRLQLSERLVEAARNGASDPCPAPTYVEGHPFGGAEFAGLHAITARIGESKSSRDIESRGRLCGREVGGADADYLYLSHISALLDDSEISSGSGETEAVFTATRAMLANRGWSFSDVCRTWFYLRDILSWYDDFNSARNHIFHDFGLYDEEARGVIPASTGIEGRNEHGSWCTLDLLAMRPVESKRFSVRRLLNPVQNEAPDYGSAFSRGIDVSAGDGRYVFVSGTASIDNDGATIHIGDFRRQTEQTLETIEALLAQAGAGLADIAQATAFVKRAEDVETFNEIINASELRDTPIVCMLADVCRDDLLFELDATAIVE